MLLMARCQELPAVATEHDKITGGSRFTSLGRASPRNFDNSALSLGQLLKWLFIVHRRCLCHAFGCWSLLWTSHSYGCLVNWVPQLPRLLKKPLSRPPCAGALTPNTNID